MALAACSLSTPLRDLETALPIAHLDLSERERERELDKYASPLPVYFRSAGIEPVRAGVEHALAEGGRSSDATLTALAQLGSLKLQCERSFISLIDTSHQYIIGEATRSHALYSDRVATPSDAIYLGVRALELHWGVCPTTIQVFTGARKPFTTKVITADPDFYIIRDFTADPTYADREYIVGWPHMRSYLEVPLRVKGGAVIGSYCVVHTEPREFSKLDIETLDEIGGCIVDHLELLRIKQDHDRAQHLISGLGTIVAGSLNSLSTVTSPLQPMQNSRRTPQFSPYTPDTNAPAVLELNTLDQTVDGAYEGTKEEHMSPDADSLRQNLEELKLDDDTIAKPAQQLAASNLSSSAALPSSSDIESPAGNEHESRRDSHDGDDDESMFADITKSIYQSMEVNGVLILDSQVADSAAESLYSRSPSRRHSSFEAHSTTHNRNDSADILFCEEVGIFLGPGKESAVISPSKQLPSSVLHWLLKQYPAGAILRREKDACLLDQELRRREQGEETINAVAAAFDAKESLFEYLDGPLQIILAPMWAASHRSGPLCTLSWTRERMRLFEEDDVALLSAFCNSAVANLARKDAVHTMQTKSKFMESISHELRSPIHGILASAELLESRYTDEESRSLLSNIQISGGTLLDTMNQLLVFTEMGNEDRVHLKDGGITTKIDGDMTNGMRQINLGTLIEEVVDSISLGHTVKSAHGKGLEMKRKGISSNRTFSNALAPIVTVVTIHPEAAESVRTPVGVLRRLLMIFYSNALNHTSHGHIEVELCLAAKPDEVTKRAVQLIVKDSGRGISQRYQDSRMFLPFSQENTNSSGVGLGLSIAHRFVRNFGGTIDVESKEGIGTAMQVTIPFGDFLALELQPEGTDAYLPTLLRPYVKGRRVCLVTSGGLPGNSQTSSKPSINDSTYDVLARSLGVTLTKCFGMNIVTEAESPEAHLEIDGGEVFISCSQNRRARESKIQTPISPRTVAVAVVRAFDLNAALDNKTREMLHIYQPLIAQNTGLPFTAAGPAPPPTIDDTQDVCSDGESKLRPSVEDDQGDGERKALGGGKQTTNVLIVDDNEVNLRVLGACMKKSGYSHSFAADGQAAIDAFQAREKGPFNLIFMDLSMPVLDGFQAIKGVRALEDQMGWTPATIVVLSAFGTDESKKRAIKCGCDIFLTKPVSPKKIRETVKLLNL
ncbi:hypothetical protein MBLNU13_g10474t1 [Cladosporium sp. NU13]